MIEQFKTIYYNRQNDKITPFLKSLKAKDKKLLAKELKSMQEKSAVKEGWKELFWMTALVCCTKTQFVDSIIYCDDAIDEYADEVLEWACPEWFSSAYNKYAEDEFHYPPNYLNLVRWLQKGYLHPSGLLIARSLSKAISCRDESNRNWVATPHILEQNPITLDEHVWTLFEYETSIDWDDTNMYNENKESDLWKKALLKHSQNGRIDRLRLLRACLNTVTYDFKNYLAGWYVDLLVYLQPTDEELLAIQDELFATFMGKYSKMINRVLDLLKRIATHQAFQVDDFLSQSGLLLSSEVKSVVNSTLTILDKVAKSNKDKQAAICLHLALTFFHKDESIQTKAAKLLLRYGDASSAGLKDALQPYSSSMLMSVKELLKEYLKEATLEANPVGEAVFEAIPVYDDSRLLPVPRTPDDLIFFLLQLFENGEAYQVDLLPAALLQLTKEVTPSKLEQLELPLQKAYEICLSKPFYHSFHHSTKTFETTYFWGYGSYYNLAALFFVHYCQHLAEQFPKHSEFISELHREAVNEDKRKAQATKGDLFQYDRQITPLPDWIYSKHKPFYACHRIMIQALEFIKKGIALPLLSTPTHQPCWVAPEALVDRLLHYQQAGQMPDTADVQLALARIAPEGVDDLIRLATDKLTGDYRHIILAYYTPQQESTESKSLFSLFTPKSTPCTLTNIAEHIRSYTYGISDKKEKDSTYTERSVLEITIPPSPWTKENNHYAGISDHLRLCIGPQDIHSFIYSYPATAPIPFALIAKDRFRFAQIPEAETRDFLTASVAALFELKVEIASATSLFLTCCMLCSEKTIRNYAAEIWIERTAANLINPADFGADIGRLEQVEWAPIKRLTDLINDRMINLSPRHNQALETMITSILAQLDKPITNLKKLLEIYSELLALNHSKVATEVIPQLQAWAGEKSLKKVINQLTNNQS